MEGCKEAFEYFLPLILGIYDGTKHNVDCYIAFNERTLNFLLNCHGVHFFSDGNFRAFG